MSEVEIVVAYLTIAVGLALVYYFVKRRIISGTLFGTLCLAMGLLLLGGLSGFIPAVLDVNLGFAIVFGVFIALYFVSGKNSRTLLLIAIPILLLVLYFL